MTYIQPVVEDQVQEYIVKKLFSEIRNDLILLPALGLSGHGYIKKKIHGFNMAANFTPYVILTDLDMAPCPSALKEKWLDFIPAPGLLFRIAVREAESWLLADRDNLASFFGVSVKNIPLNSEDILEPKAFMINLARHSSKRYIREDVVPNGTSSIGPGYNLRLTEFIVRKWDWNLACVHSRSLSNSVDRISNWHIGV